MKSIAFVFTHAPHGDSSGREGLDAALAASAQCENIALFFTGDGVLQLMSHQQPEKIMARHYVATFGVLPLYDITHCFLCADSLAERGLTQAVSRVLDVEVLPANAMREKLEHYDHILTF